MKPMKENLNFFKLNKGLRLSQKRSRKSRRGLTLVELAIVILVLGVIMGIVYSSLDFGITDDAKRLAVQSSSKQLQMAWERFEFDHEPIQDGATLEILTKKSDDNPNWRPIDKKLVMDTWNKPYFICSSPDGTRNICSNGADGSPGGSGKNADFMLTDSNTWPAWLSGSKEK
jgi:general secretion pathway protein G